MISNLPADVVGHAAVRRLHRHARASLVLCALLLALCGCGRPTGTPAGKSTPTSNAVVTTNDNSLIKAKSQRVLEDAVNAATPGCSAAVGSKGTVVWTGVRGIADTATGAKISPDTVFDIGSVSKQFTATAILLLADAGKLTLGDPLSQHMPDFPKWAATVTIAQLIHHTSGIPEYEGLLVKQGFAVSDRTTQDQALQAVAALPQLNFKPGTQFRYSDSNYLLLGEIVHRVSGVPLPQFLSAEIFGPLGVGMVMDPVGEVPHKAVSYAGGSDGYRTTTSAWEQIGDGAVQASPSQLVQWGDNYRTGRVGGPRLLEEQLAGAVEIGPGIPVRYGAGIYIKADGSLDHDGASPGFVTAFRVSNDRQTSVAVSCNTDDQIPEALADSIAKLWM
ncbi:serine hydrolase domain-containing protein [Mycobacterium sp. Aquia_213]|uniref:serine hydrolase domain-containing protein n=1 Tax=Mycobacterium sp. Aquia_213 TaxID=2991728 RepID=UPI0022714A3F|nr:serine hydrolase domain-containing protein [Mycobacterium sp. Aquia_213]WAC93945.1 serine hydrolase [Mycobacterium sp. Aquia_213]